MSDWFYSGSTWWETVLVNLGVFLYSYFTSIAGMTIVEETKREIR
jgi:hypothetical protein